MMGYVEHIGGGPGSIMITPAYLVLKFHNQEIGITAEQLYQMFAAHIWRNGMTYRDIDFSKLSPPDQERFEFDTDQCSETTITGERTGMNGQLDLGERCRK